jgi:hypothetical protein
MEKINLEGDHVPWNDRELKHKGLVLEPMKLTHLVKICWIRQANGIHILDALNALLPLNLNLKHQSFLLLDQRE